MEDDKQLVHDYWNQASCGETLHLRNTEKQGYIAQAGMRYRLEPYILDFARFEEARGLRLLEIGVGLGADHQKFAEAGAALGGIDLTERAVEHTRRRLVAFGLHSQLAGVTPRPWISRTRPSTASIPGAFCITVRIRPRPSAKSGVCSSVGGRRRS